MTDSLSKRLKRVKRVKRLKRLDALIPVLPALIGHKQPLLKRTSTFFACRVVQSRVSAAQPGNSSSQTRSRPAETGVSFKQPANAAMQPGIATARPGIVQAETPIRAAECGDGWRKLTGKQCAKFRPRRMTTRDGHME
jgi:hypothetical protein